MPLFMRTHRVPQMQHLVASWSGLCSRRFHAGMKLALPRPDHCGGRKIPDDMVIPSPAVLVLSGRAMQHFGPSWPFALNFVYGVVSERNSLPRPRAADFLMYITTASRQHNT